MDLAILIPLAPFIMVLGIIYLVNQRKLEEKRIAATAEASSEKAAQYASRVQQLEDRVRVLERIVTDKGYDVATQIDQHRRGPGVRRHRRQEVGGQPFPQAAGVERCACGHGHRRVLLVDHHPAADRLPVADAHGVAAPASDAVVPLHDQLLLQLLL